MLLDHSSSSRYKRPIMSNSPLSNTLKTPAWLQAAIWTVACVLLALVQLPWAGYQVGVGNQGIQIAFLEKLRDHELLLNDAMVTKTIVTYPSFFFHLCAKLLSLTHFDFSTLYLWLHIVATAGVFAAVAGLARAMTRNALAPVVCVLLLIAGHHQALAGETLYSPGFTHTWAVFPLSLLALYLFFKDRHVAAFVLAGLIFNFHALEAGHLLAIMGFAALFEIRRVGFWTLAIGAALFLVAAGPTLGMMVRHNQPATDLNQWLQLMHIRSADHSFPSSWWHEDALTVSNVPRFACILALAAVALGFRLPPRMKRKALLLVAAVGILFLIGTVFTDVHPVALVIRAQLFRSSRLLEVIALVLIAHGCAVSLTLPWRGRSRAGETARSSGFSLPPEGIPASPSVADAPTVSAESPVTTRKGRALPFWGAWLEFANALVTLACLAIPSMLPALPCALVLAILVALINGRLAWYEAFFSGGTLLLCLVAYQTIQFVIIVPGVSPGSLHQLLSGTGPSLAGWGLLVLAIALAVVAARKVTVRVAYPALATGVICVLVALVLIVPTMQQRSVPDRDWMQVQQWAKDKTPSNALFLTRPQDSGFRIYSDRAVVGEWRDGTQLYFNGAFADEWWERMNALQPGMAFNPNGTWLNHGKPLDQLEDEQILQLAQRYHADYVVLPRSDRHFLERTGCQNAQWIVYKAKLAEVAGVPTGDVNLPEENKFLQQTALPNIEKFRKSDAQVTILDPSGKPVQGISYKVTQTASTFGFGCSLPFFQTPKVDPKADYLPPAVTPEELAHFKEVFNYSVIPFSGQWRFLEPAQNQANFADLDQYVDWCVANGVQPEFRFLSGYQPQWYRQIISNEQSATLLAHVKQLAQRYGSKINQWQVTSEDVGLKEIGLKDTNSAKVTTFFKELRTALSKAQLGIADDARFWSPPLRTGTAATEDMLRGLDTLKALKKADISIDYFALEAKHPLGLWASGKQIYDTLDAFAKEGGEKMKIHITEFGVAVGDRIEGSVRDGVWDDKTRAEYYERFFTICYSHPNVDVINVMGMGPKTWIDGQGLLDAKYDPTAAFSRLKELITQRWRTQVSDKLASNGQIAFRGFHGSYVLAITLPDGKVLTAPFSLVPLAPGSDLQTTNIFRFTFNASAGTLTRADAQGGAGGQPAADHLAVDGATVQPGRI